MPIRFGIKGKPISFDDFHSLDYEVMGLAFSIHKDLGRFWNEKIYQNELGYRCCKAGFENVAMEVPIHVSYEDFIKVFKIDLLINNAIYELKATQTLTGNHEKQTINYLMLTGLNHAKLINMRPSSVQHRFVSTKITPTKRFGIIIDDKHWLEFDEKCEWLMQLFKDLIHEWGMFLEVNLFYDAIIHFLGGEDAVIKQIDVRNGSRLLGRQKIHLISSDVAFRISSVTKEESRYEVNFRRFIQHTSLKAIHWINFNHNKVHFKTVQK